MARLAYSVLGGLGAQIDSETVELGTRKQRAVLAQLLLSDGDPVSVDRLIDGIWGSSAPDRAEVSVQAYISGLRKALEPDRKPRSPSTVLITRGSGYALVADDDQVDVRLLVRRITDAHERHRAGDPAGAAEVLQAALTRYRPLLPEFEGLSFRDAAAQHLARTITEAQELSFEVRLALGEHRALVAELEQAVQRSPLDENLWVLLATARYRLGRQSDALGAIAEARRVLAEEIGVDPGPRLRALERDILDHAPTLDAPTPPARVVVAAPTEPALSADADPGRPAPPATDALIGRTDELAVLHKAVLASLQGPGGVVVVEGEPGAGKTALLDEAATRAAGAADLEVLWGRCVEDAAAPSMWPWVQVLGAVLPEIDSADRTRLLDSDLGRMVTQGSTVIPPPREMPDATARFRFYDQAADLLEGVAETHLLIIVLDDLQWADNATLELFAHMAARRPPGVTFFASLRSSSHRPAVANILAALARLPGHRRIEVGPLTDDDISEMVRRETHEWPAAGTTESIARRTGGNAFFVRELARILADRGSIGDNAVPAGVRDVVRERLRPLGPDTIALLEMASLIGNRVDLGLVAAATDQSVDAALDALDAADAAGLVDVGDDPFSFTFNHDLIREAVVDQVGATRARRMHLAIARQLDTRRMPNATAQRARHLWAAGPLADRLDTARALLAAGELSMRTYNFDVAEQQLSDAARLARAGGDVDLELAAITTRLFSDVARSGYFAADRELLSRARELGESTSDVALLANLDYARGAAHSQVADTRAAHRVAEELRGRAESSDDPVVVHLGMQLSAIDRFDRGHIGDAHRLLESYAPLDSDVAGLHTDQIVLARGFRAWSATLHVSPAAGRRVFDRIDVGPDDPVSHLGVGIFAVTAGAMSGDIDWVQEVGERLLSSSDHRALEYLRRGGERIYWWARALGDAPDEALGHLDRLDHGDHPQRTGIGLWLALHAEALTAAGRLERVPALLEQAQAFAERTGQRYPDAHRLLVCAEFQHCAAHPANVVQDTLREARRVALTQEAATLVARIESFASDHGYAPDAG
ncbi:BTAD domain-containing putative transcriptional regulator [Gordonia insulae]|uniref:Transcriptional regulatory protein EmbR n=1 Tax=Gordonia insulae TaxID=2420509 RepID=A0A3G8JJH9_9ACTN|nr:BTAD domain-containing putative transcriptional regulator [Gordonia insulae]AZG44692.1 Transcriptional regulatory protein EmbR [Gordonia insulae]